MEHLPPAPPLPHILSEDKRVKDPQECFTFDPRHSRYQYLRLLGHGAYGMVCAAADRQDGTNVAIKRINQINSILVARRTLRELRLLRHFRGHPNIISIRDLFLLKGGRIVQEVNWKDTGSFDELYISQDLMDADLCHIIQSKHPLGEEHCQRFLYQILRGLKALHSANVIHRDLKPGNLLWRHNGDLKICDFGLARGISEQQQNLQSSGTSTANGQDRFAGAAGAPPETVLTNYVATRWYRPPEILLYRSNYGKSLDIWSVGCIFAELLGRKVFLPGQSGFEQLHLILQKLGTPSDEIIDSIPSARSRTYLRRLPHYPAYPLSRRFPSASPEAIDLLEKMLCFDPRRRINVEDALAHSYLARYHNPAYEPEMAPFDFDFDRRCVTLTDIKTAILQEVLLYRPEPIPPAPQPTSLSVRLDRLRIGEGVVIAPSQPADSADQDSRGASKSIVAQALLDSKASSQLGNVEDLIQRSHRVFLPPIRAAVKGEHRQTRIPDRLSPPGVQPQSRPRSA